MDYSSFDQLHLEILFTFTTIPNEFFLPFLNHLGKKSTWKLFYLFGPYLLRNTLISIKPKPKSQETRPLRQKCPYLNLHSRTLLWIRSGTTLWIIWWIVWIAFFLAMQIYDQANLHIFLYILSLVLIDLSLNLF